MELRVIRLLESMFNDETDFERLWRSLKELLDDNCQPVLVASSSNTYAGDARYGCSNRKCLDLDPTLIAKKENRFCQVLSVILKGRSLKCVPLR
ncbi:MAG TPA: hypothetical protein PLV56_09015, partial [Synergistales bacterium]|nr:hypothetical protein [Synergistales bacterium]